MLLARLITTSLVSKPRGRKISSNLWRSSCCSSADTSLHCETITFSVSLTSLTDHSFSSASTPTTAEISQIYNSTNVSLASAVLDIYQCYISTRHQSGIQTNALFILKFKCIHYRLQRQLTLQETITYITATWLQICFNNFKHLLHQALKNKQTSSFNGP